MSRMSKFTPADWASWCGAEKFADGSDPQIGEIVVDGETSDVIAHGAGIFIAGPFGDALGIDCRAKAATLAIAALLPPTISEVGLRALGMKEIG